MYTPAFLAQAQTLLADALPRWGLGHARLSLLNISENATFLAEAAGRRVVLRLYRPGCHSAAEIASELAWIMALRAGAVVPTPAPLPALDGTLLQTLPGGAGPCHVMAFAHSPGAEPPASALVPWFRRLGGLAARLHAHGRGWARPPGFTRRRWDFATMLGERPHWGDWRAGTGLDAAGRAVLEQVAARLRAQLAAYGEAPHRFGLVHADLRLANLLAEGEALHVIDFDDCGFCWFLYDFAASVSFIEHTPQLPALAAAWVAGYRAVAPLAAEDLAMLPAFVMLRRLLLTAWLASHAETPTAQALGPAHTAGTVALGRDFLAGILIA